MRKIILKVGIDVSVSLSVLVNMRKSLARILGMNPAALHLVTVEEGCITFQLVGSLADEVFSGKKSGIFTQEKLWRLEALSILSLTCGNYVWDLNSGDSSQGLVNMYMYHITACECQCS
jgi:hypothetical protein